ncbi:MAG: TRAP transporter substrate-binding protein [Clostridiales Family XIII bacterium]|jgi:TRAP-type C4-dicarboxylate transport system substrate-binding protein|nr:TRAP transporter substrate-binding protein [Clostridiales Family XIII bacterium]
MKKILVIALALVMLLAVTACGGGSNTSENTGNTGSTDSAGGDNLPPITLKMANYLPSGNPIEDYVVNPLAEGLKEANITLEYYPGATLLEGNQILDGVIQGTADIGYATIAYETGRLPISFMIEYPTPYASAKAASYTLKELYETLQMPELDEIHVLFPIASGPGAILSKDPIRTLADMKGLQIRANAIQAESMKVLGAVPATLSMGETYDALRSGIVDAFVGLTGAGAEFKLQEVTTNFTYYPFCNVGFYIIMNKDVYNALTDEQKRIVDEVSARVFEESASGYCELTGQASIDAFSDSTHEVITLSDEEIAKFAAATSTMLDDYAKSLDEKGLNGTEAKELLLEIAARNNDKYPYGSASN